MTFTSRARLIAALAFLHITTCLANPLAPAPLHARLTKIYGGESYAAALRPATNAAQYAVEVKLNGVPRYLIVDTGSSDTWMVAEDYQCTNSNLKPVPSSTCNFGTTYSGPFDTIKDVNFQELYGSGELVLGKFGRADVSVAGIEVANQQVALVDKAYYFGDGIVSGIVGLASRLTTQKYPGNDPEKNTADQVIEYPPIFESMYNRTGQIQPLFSLALERGPGGGYLAFGGLPPIDFAHDFVSSKFVSVPLNKDPSPKRYYPIKPQGYELAGKSYNSSYVAIVDSGTYANRLPAPIAKKINAAFDPPAKYNSAVGVYQVACNATAPEFGFQIAGRTFHMNKEDMIISAAGQCITAFTDGLPVPKKTYPKGFFILGAAFLRNVVAVFDVGNGQMHFAAHENY